MGNLTTGQKFILDKKRQETSYLWKNPSVGDEVYAMGKEGLSDNEIIWRVSQDTGKDLIDFSPEGVSMYLKERGLTTQIRKAIKYVPVVSEANKGIVEIGKSSENDAVRLKALIWLADKYDLDTEPKGDKVTNNIFQMNKITQIIVE